MSQPASTEPPKQPRKRTFADFAPEKLEVPTSVGILWLRHPAMTELARFADIPDDGLRGREVIVVLASRSSEKQERGPLSEEDFARLSSDDVKALAGAIPLNCKWSDADPENLEGLGRSAQRSALKQLETWEQASRDMYTNLAGSYSFLKPDALATLQRQMAEVSRATSAVASLTQFPKLDHLLQDIGAKSRVPLGDELSAKLPADVKVVAPTGLEAREMLARPIEIARPPSFEETTFGRATLEALQLNRTNAAHTAQMAGAVSNLQRTFISIVFPQWTTSLKESQAGAEQTFRQAAHSLVWTKWTLVASVAVTIGVAVFQFIEARNAGVETAAQTERSNAILHQQVELQQRMLQEQAKAAAAMRESIDSLRTSQAARKQL